MMRALQAAILLVATLGAGLMAGLFAGFAYAVMPGLGRSGDRTFVQAMRHINRAIRNGWFLLPFLLPIPLLALATVLARNGHGRGVLPWILAALVTYLAGFFVTAAVNVPLNNALDTLTWRDRPAPDGSGGGGADGNEDDQGDQDYEARAGDDEALKAARGAFERRWVIWNIVRAVLHTAAFTLLAWTLFLYGLYGAGGAT
ncbi:anthrone oxygenase family protein [Streptomyces lydicus]